MNSPSMNLPGNCLPKPAIIAVTMGDAAGIGPEVVVRALSGLRSHSELAYLVIGHPAILSDALALTKSPLSIRTLNRLPDSAASLFALVDESARTGQIVCWNPTDDQVLNAARGQVSAAAGDAAFRYLSAAIALARAGIVDAIATAPLNKESLSLAGHHFPGHTEILADQCGIQEFAMMLYLPESRLSPLRRLIQSPDSLPESAVHQGLSIAHVTLHTSIASVPQLLTRDGVLEKIRLVSDFLQQIQCERRAVAVCALNPHGGENGLFGDEESRIISPAVAEARRMGIHVSGPLPVDTLIRRAMTGEFDGVVAMYHDQGHIPVKLIGFDSAVNITLGLPIVRTSPTHGTAFDRAWNKNTPADSSGMQEAILMAARLSSWEGEAPAEPKLGGRSSR